MTDESWRGKVGRLDNAGIPPLRSAIARKVTERNALPAQPEQVVVTAGGMQALHTSFGSTISAGDEVLVPDPG